MHLRASYSSGVFCHSPGTSFAVKQLLFPFYTEIPPRMQIASALVGKSWIFCSQVLFLFSMLFPMKNGHGKKVFRPVLGRGVAQRVLVYKRGLGRGCTCVPLPALLDAGALLREVTCDGQSQWACVCKEPTIHHNLVKRTAETTVNQGGLLSFFPEVDCGAHIYLAWDAFWNSQCNILAVAGGRNLPPQTQVDKRCPVFEKGKPV